jgi:hypothetical protein
MAQINIYVPDPLRDRVKAAGINVSRICQEALEAAVRFKEQQGVPGDSVRLQQPVGPPAPTWEQVCPHPRHERTPYGVCRACGQPVKVKR